MPKQTSAQKISIFFYLALINDAIAVEAANMAYNKFLEKKKRSPVFSDAVLLVSAIEKVWSSYKNSYKRGTGIFNPDSGWTIPNQFDVGPWREFQKKAAPDELSIALYIRVLKFTDKEVAEGLGISEGAVRYRSARAYRRLGKILTPFNYGKGADLHLLVR